MLNVLRAELLKLRRSLALLVVVVAPSSVAALAGAALLTRSDGTKWERYLDEGLAMWSFFMLPLAVTTIAMLLAQMEHAERLWTHLLAQPASRRSQFLAKFFVLLGALVAMNLILPLEMFAAGFGVDALFGGARLVGDTQVVDMFLGMAWMALGALPLAALQLWLAIVACNFVIPLAVGIVGTFVVLVGTAAHMYIYLPWGLPIYATMWPKVPGEIGVIAGLVGGAFALAFMLVELERREIG